MKKAYKYLIFIIVIALVVGAVIGLSIFQNKNIEGNVVSVEVKSSSGSNSQLVVITKDNLAGFLQAQQLIKDIPDKGGFILKLYNFNSGNRQIEDSYVLKKGKVEMGDREGDAVIYLHSKYVSQLGDFCSAMRSAKQNGDLGYETKMSEISFMWKYKSLLKYKSCFGL